MTRRSLAATALVAVVSIAVLVPLARSEARRHAVSEMRGMRTVLRAIGRLDSPTLAGYRILPQFDCLTYRRGREPFALEVCVDSAGRVVEAIDRRSKTPRVWSLREKPTASTLQVGRGRVERILRRAGVLPGRSG